MINFRYHIITLVAVFLALGLGVLFGASFIDQSTVEGLKSSQERLGNRNKTLRDQVVALQERNESLTGFAASSRDLLIHNSLKDRAVVVVSFESSFSSHVEAVEETLVKANARIEASISLSEELGLRTTAQRRRTASALESSSLERDDLSELAINGLSAALSGRRPGLIQRLIDEGLVSTREPQGAQLKPPGEIASSGSAVVVVPSTGRDLRERFSLPLVRALSAQAVVTAVTESGSGSSQVLGPLRDDSDLKVVTVDGLSDPVGQTALVLGLKGAFDGVFGHYGSGEGASTVLPGG